MPFTVSHAVVALPLRRTALPASAVAVGAMTPDLRLFVPFAPLYSTTHSLAWLPVTTLLAGALWLAWRVVVLPAASDLSPSWCAARYAGSSATGATASPARRRLLATAALALGVLTHVVWDAFTHHGRWGVALAPVLDDRVRGLDHLDLCAGRAMAVARDHQAFDAVAPVVLDHARHLGRRLAGTDDDQAAGCG